MILDWDEFYKKVGDFITISDWIHVIAITISAIISVISIIIAVKSLKMTQKSIEDANKPYIACYIDMVEVGHFQKYFIIENFGKTPATILDIKFNKLIEGLGRDGKVESLKGYLIAPNQKAITTIDIKEKRDFSVTISYQDMKDEIIVHTYHLNSGFSSDLMYKTSDSSKYSDETNLLEIF